MGTSGAVVYRKNVDAADAVSILLPALSKGFYIVQVSCTGSVYNQKILIR
jgi:hypothetical protein